MRISDWSSDVCSSDLVEAALSTIMDGEDSVAVVDAEDKLLLYGNWLGLMQGTLSASFGKQGRELERTLEGDRSYSTAGGGTLTLPGRSLMLIRDRKSTRLNYSQYCAHRRPSST